MTSDTSAVGKQETEGTDLSFGKISFGTKTASIDTYGGYTTLSRQTIERSTTPMLNTAITALQNAYAKATEKAVRDHLYAEIKAQRDDMSVLQREVDAAQKALDLVLQRLTQTNLESQAQQANVSILTPATVPSTPFRPKPTLNIVVGALLGLVVGVLAVLTLEIAHRPIRSPEDLMTAANMPVLAVLPPADSRRSRRLIGDTGPTVLAIGGSGGPLRLGH